MSEDEVSIGKPRHLGIIPDGTRRWSRRTSITLSDAYRSTFRKVCSMIGVAHRAGFAEITVYVLSRFNLLRPKEQVEAVCSAFDALAEGLNELFIRGKAYEVRVLGELESISPTQAAKLQNLTGLAGATSGCLINLLVAYDAWDEIADAQRRASGPVRIEHLWVPAPVDVVIRTGGSALLSGFLPLQSQYALILCPDCMFNDLSEDDISDLVERASAVQHRWGR